MNKIIVLDFAGTLIKAKVIEEANKFRTRILLRALPSKKEHADPELLYKANRDFVKMLTGLKKNMKIKYRENDLDFIQLNGEEVQNQIATNLFQIGMYMAAKKYKKKMMEEGIEEQLKIMKKKGYKLAIVSGVRTDIISGMLAIAGIKIDFDYIYGQPPILGLENQKYAVKELRAKGKIKYIIGDKISDLERVPEAKKIFVKWGHPSGGEEKKSDYIISKTKELEKVIL
ncbi:MAG: HAD hydrolase-like protein [Candidatus Woesearchaeota archaeon]